MHTDNLACNVEQIQIESSWKEVLQQEFKLPYMCALKSFLVQQQQLGKVIFPAEKDVFSAFKHTPFDRVRVVILGQDPYHGPQQAHGMCFSVLPGVKPPPSLVNIYKELQADLQIAPPQHGYLVPWAEQGVLLLNSVLTVEQGQPGSHKNKGWEQFTDRVIATLNNQTRPLIFVLWGNYALQKGAHIDSSKHLILRAAHPSPFSAYRGFLGCKHFSKINAQLQAWGQQPINWQL